MQLPGGIGAGRSGGLRRDFSFRPLTGALELSISEAGEVGRCLPEMVTEVLCAALSSLGGVGVTEKQVWALSVQDRQFLMQQLAVMLGQGQRWLTETCGRCGERLQALVDMAQVPVRPAGPSFPLAEVQTSAGQVRARVPTGEDQRAVAELEEGMAERELLARCLEDRARAEALSEEDAARVEEALERVAPGVPLAATTICPACGCACIIVLDPYVCLWPGAGLLDEVHTLASAYHWSERDILRLPRVRRQKYLALVDAARRMAS